MFLSRKQFANMNIKYNEQSLSNYFIPDGNAVGSNVGFLVGEAVGCKLH